MIKANLTGTETELKTAIAYLQQIKLYKEVEVTDEDAGRSRSQV